MTPWERIVQSHDNALAMKKAPLVKPPVKQCSVCKQFLSKEQFYAKPENINGLRASCKTCFIKARKRYVVP